MPIAYAYADCQIYFLILTIDAGFHMDHSLFHTIFPRGELFDSPPHHIVSREMPRDEQTFTSQEFNKLYIFSSMPIMS